jgi:hypothetical protein
MYLGEKLVIGSVPELQPRELLLALLQMTRVMEM